MQPFAGSHLLPTMIIACKERKVTLRALAQRSLLYTLAMLDESTREREVAKLDTFSRKQMEDILSTVPALDAPEFDVQEDLSEDHELFGLAPPTPLDQAIKGIEQLRIFN